MKVQRELLHAAPARYIVKLWCGREMWGGQDSCVVCDVGQDAEEGRVESDNKLEGGVVEAAAAAERVCRATKGGARDVGAALAQ